MLFMQSSQGQGLKIHYYGPQKHRHMLGTFILNVSAAVLKAEKISSKSSELLLTKRRAWFNTGDDKI